jgi:hypothetical protein
MSSDSSVESKRQADMEEQAHRIRTKERVPGHTNYYEKDGLRTEGDNEDHEHEPPVGKGVVMFVVS